MKRGGPPERRTRLRRRTPLRQGTGRTREESEHWREVKGYVRDRANGRCQGCVIDECTGWGEHAHHIQLRSQGGPDEAWNCVWLCRKCHRWLHEHPVDAQALGLIRGLTPWSTGVD